MFNLSFSIRNPFKPVNWSCLYNNEWKLSKNKSLEVQIDYYTYHLAELDIDTNFNGESHAGPEFQIGFLGLCYRVKLYDHRHWNQDEWRWCKYDEPDEW